MSLIQTPWTSQPQQAVGIDWSNQITRGLEFVTVASNGARDILANVNSSNIGSSVKQVATRAGASFGGFDGGTTSSYIEFSHLPLLGPQIQKTFVLCGVTLGSTAVGKAWFINNYWNSVFLPGGQVRLTHIGIGDYVLSGNIISAGVPCSIVMTQNSSTSQALLFKDGVFVSNTTTDNNSGGTNSGGNFKIGRNTTTSAPLTTGDAIAGFYQINRAVSVAEGIALSQNPWQIFKPIPRRIFVPVSAGTSDGTGTGSLSYISLSSPTGTASGTGTSSGTGTGSLASSSLSAPSAAATGSALATGALTTVTLTTVTASAIGSALATGSLDAIDLSTVSGSATGTTAGNAEGVGAVSTIALSAPAASAVGSALATGSFSHVSLSTVSGTASAATNGQATADLQPISISAPLAIAIASSVATGGIQSIGLTAPTASATGQAQTIARPGSDTSNSGWTPSTGSDLYAMLDEVTPNDSDYISTTSAGSVCRLGLGAVADPGTSSGQVVSYRASSSTGNGLKVELMQGGTVIATWNHANLPTTDTTYQQSLSAAECDAITDYTALSVRLTSL